MSDYPASVARALRFWSRLPLPVLPFEIDPHAPPVMTVLAPAAPAAGALIGLLGALVLALAHGLGLPAWPAAIAAVAALVLATGALHEDALADVADGFGGGGTIVRKLEIMKDPRLGSYGAAALSLALLAKVALLGELLARHGPWRAAAALVAAAAMARIAGLWPLVALPPARVDGAGAAAGMLAPRPWRVGAGIGAGIAVVLVLPACGWLPAVLAPAAALATAWGVARLADRQIGGQTGDVCGAATGLAELAFLAVALAFSRA
ncbi:adenosylcobinamide-GDP ribazoletransferase [Labrys wisconsinensis]|uniref:Adenosylcobinamide-GDP ribazoletransferase n=1 Tax=Labrys wisconsinensis TaxID=425677 RepID=A0ABU0JCM3_9HYPH|nr:adenosylcobinamide-GDP ribazoletransferase [Labrys wisconsinensis]MDQ0471014.1 adenosylcobinamide-GDP ribazoletransferase [Labrys wisconsinensis]